MKSAALSFNDIQYVKDPKLFQINIILTDPASNFWDKINSAVELAMLPSLPIQ